MLRNNHTSRELRRGRFNKKKISLSPGGSTCSEIYWPAAAWQLANNEKI